MTFGVARVEVQGLDIARANGEATSPRHYRLAPAWREQGGCRAHRRARSRGTPASDGAYSGSDDLGGCAHIAVDELNQVAVVIDGATARASRDE